MKRRNTIRFIRNNCDLEDFISIVSNRKKFISCCNYVIDSGLEFVEFKLGLNLE